MKEGNCGWGAVKTERKRHLVVETHGTREYILLEFKKNGSLGSVFLKAPLTCNFQYAGTLILKLIKSLLRPQASEIDEIRQWSFVGWSSNVLAFPLPNQL